MADYTHEIFISYRNLPGVNDWVWKTFRPELEKKLNFCLKGRFRIFLDRHLDKGDWWAETIADAVHRSKVFVAVLVPSYETSDWCLAELACIEAREKCLKRYKVPGHGLVVPISLTKKERLSEDLCRRQLIDFRMFAHDGEPFRRSRGYVQFQEAMMEVAERIATLLEERTSPWDASWPKLVLPPKCPRVSAGLPAL